MTWQPPSLPSAAVDVEDHGQQLAVPPCRERLPRRMHVQVEATLPNIDTVLTRWQRMAWTFIESSATTLRTHSFTAPPSLRTPHLPHQQQPCDGPQRCEAGSTCGWAAGDRWADRAGCRGRRPTARAPSARTSAAREQTGLPEIGPHRLRTFPGRHRREVGRQTARVGACGACGTADIGGHAADRDERRERARSDDLHRSDHKSLGTDFGRLCLTPTRHARRLPLTHSPLGLADPHTNKVPRRQAGLATKASERWAAPGRRSTAGTCTTSNGSWRPCCDRRTGTARWERRSCARRCTHATQPRR
jgi:hypothetical protein